MSAATSLKASAIAFLQLAASGQVDEAFGRFVGPAFRHHNPHFSGDAGSLKAAMLDNATQFPNKAFEVQRAIADEEMLVAVHSRIRLKPDAPSIAVVHIFRFEGQQIAELWDVGQPEPDNMVNQYGMF